MSEGNQMSENGTWSTREAAYYLGLSNVAVLSKKDILGGKLVGRGYRWPIEKVKAYAEAVKGKSLRDPTRGQELKK
jgi:hypothetical protein